MRIAFGLVGVFSLVSHSVGAFAQKPGACDRDTRTGNVVSVATPIGVVEGKICLDDGDSFLVGPTPVRIRGIDAPEIGRGCLKNFPSVDPRCMKSGAAIEGLNVLSNLLDAGATCAAEKRENRNRWVVDCSLPSKTDLATEMIKRGFACATRQRVDLRTLELEHFPRRLGQA